MTLPSSGTITAAQINTELNRAAGTTVSFDAVVERELSQRSAGTSVAMSNFHSKSVNNVNKYITDDVFSGTAVTSRTFSSKSIGTAYSTRRVFVTVGWHWTNASNFTLTSLTIGGVAATIHIQDSHSGGSTGVGSAIASLVVTSGTTANIVTNFSNGVNGISIGVFSCYTLQNSSPTATQFARGAGFTTVSHNISCPTYGTLIMSAAGSTNTAGHNITITGGTEKFQNQHSGMHAGSIDSGLSSGSKSIGMSVATNPSNAGVELVALTWV